MRALGAASVRSAQATISRAASALLAGWDG